MFATRLRIDFTPFDSTFPGLGRSASVTLSRFESRSSVPWLNMRPAVANCALPGDLAAIGENVVAPTDLCGHAELAQHLDDGSVEQIVAIEASMHVARHEAEIQIAEIVIDGTAAGHAPHDANARSRPRRRG